MNNPYDNLSDADLAAVINKTDTSAPKVGKIILPSEWHKYLTEAADRHGVDPAFAHAVMAVESNYQPTATSRKGAMGLMQLMPDTARQMGVQDAYNPYQNIEGGVKLLGMLGQKYGNDWQKVAHVYNSGNLNRPTDSGYVPAVMAAYRQIKPQYQQIKGEVQNPYDQMSDAELLQKLNPQVSAGAKPTLTLGQEAALPEASPEEAQAAMGLLQPQGGVPSIPQMAGQALGDPFAESVAMFSPGSAMQGLKDAGTIAAQPGGPAHLPTLGMMAGGAVGSIAGGPLGAIPGAALGAGAGKAGEYFIQGLRGDKLPSISSQALGIGTSAATGATAEMGGQVIGRVAKGLFAPGRKWLEKQIANVELARGAQELAAQGIPISPKTIAPSAPAKVVHWLAEKFQPGKSIVDSYRKQTMNMIYEMRQNFVKDMGLPPVGSMPLGTSQETIKSVFAQFKNAVGPKAEIPLPNAQLFVNQIDDAALSGKASKEYVDSLKGLLQSGKATVEQIERINAGLWPKGKAYGKMPATEKAWREEFLQSLYKDLGSHEETVGINLAKLLQSAKGTTRQIKQAEYLEYLLDKATNNDTLQFNPQYFYDLVRKSESQILRRFDKDQAQNIFNFADKMKAASPERSMFTEGRLRPSLFEQGISSGIPLALGAGAAMQSPALAVPIGFQAIVARSLMAPKGIIRKWLTTGYNPPTLPVKIGLMEGMKND